jgi:4'-phosphopantetheinyl transferase
VTLHALLPGLCLIENARVPQTACLMVLAGLLDTPAEAIVVERTSGGKPLLRAPTPAWFSRAHREGLTLVGAGRDRPLGVDLEVVRDDVPVLDIADAFFAPGEVDWLRKQMRHTRTIGFYALWTAKEAVLKATGQGITGGMHVPLFDQKALIRLHGAFDGGLRKNFSSQGSTVRISAGGHAIWLLGRRVNGRVVIAAMAAAPHRVSISEVADESDLLSSR